MTKTYLVLPARNVQDTLELSVLSGYISIRDFDPEIIVVENGSDDNTFQVATDLKSKYSHISLHVLRSNPGKIKQYGHALGGRVTMEHFLSDCYNLLAQGGKTKVLQTDFERYFITTK